MFISRNWEQIGSWTEDEVRHYFQMGQLVATDHYWRHGMTEWDLLGNIFVPPVPIAPPQIAPPVPNIAGRPPVPVIPVAPSSLTLNSPTPSSPQTNGQPPRSMLTWIILSGLGGCVLIAICALIIYVESQQNVRTNKPTDGTLPSQQTDELLTGKIAPEVRKLQRMSHDGNLDEQRNSQVALGLLKDIAIHKQACRAAEKPVFEMGMEPSKMTSLDEIDRRQAAVQATQQPLNDFTAYLQNINTTLHDNLVAKGFSPDVADKSVRDFNGTGKIQALRNYWQRESMISEDLLAILDLLKKNWGHWHSEGENVAFGDKNVLADYQALVEKLHSDTAAQKAAQAWAVGPSN
jgi:hypothetical protein